MAVSKIKVFDADITDPFPGKLVWPLRAFIELLESIEDSLPANERSTATIKSVGKFKVEYSHMLTATELFEAKQQKAVAKLEEALAANKGLNKTEVETLLAEINAIL